MFRDCWSADGQSASNIPNRHGCFFQQCQNIASSLVPQRIHDSIGMLVFGNHRVTVTQKLPRCQARTDQDYQTNWVQRTETCQVGSGLMPINAVAPGRRPCLKGRHVFPDQANERPWPVSQIRLLLVYSWFVRPKTAKDLCARRRLSDWFRGAQRWLVPSGRVRSDCGNASRQGQGCARNKHHCLRNEVSDGRPGH